MRRFWAIAVAVLAAPPASADAVRRFAVVVGNAEGGEQTRPLLYARDDAEKIYDVLLRLGGVKPQDAQLVLDGSAGDFGSALSQVERKLKEASERGERSVLIVYFSGHAKDGALRLGESRIPFEMLKQRLAQSQADIKIGIFDSCRSGALARTKGARKAPEFDVEAHRDRAAKGLVILTSSSSDEDSQESDQIRGSYFSHYLASGLMGDADRSGDGLVSLSEAYAYAYERTVADTADSAAGAQHPTFSYDLSGNGDLVLTDVGSHTEGLWFPPPLPGGLYYLVDRRGFVVVEVDKPDGKERRIAVPAGAYRLKRRLSDRLRIGDVEVVRGQLTQVDERQFRDAPFSDDPVKGVARELPARVTLALSGTYQSFFDGPTRAGLFPPAPMLGMELWLRDFLRRNWVWGFDLAVGRASGTLGLSEFSLPYHFSELTLGSSILTLWPLGDWAPFVGARVALLVMGRDFAAAGQLDQSFATWSPGLVAGVHYRLARNWGLIARGRLHYVLYNVDQNRSLGYFELGTLVSYEF